MARILSSMGLFVVLLAGILFVFWQQASVKIAGDPQWMLLAVPDEKVPPEVAVKARELLAEQPLDQPVLNLLFAIEARGDLTDARRKAFAGALVGLGWRDTPSQQNLIYEAVANQKPEDAVLRIDGLLRRGKMIDAILPIMIRLESFPPAAELLIERLELQPEWRTTYFKLGSLLRDPATLDARVRLLDRMLEEGKALRHSELKPSLDAMTREGRRGDAARIALSANRTAASAAPIYDPDFSKFIALAPEDRMSPLPFEWETFSRPGVSAQILPEGKDGELQLNWGGSGAPIFVRTMVLLADVGQPRLDVDVSTQDDLKELKMFEFRLACPGEEGVAFRPVDNEARSTSVRFRLDGSVSCEYPDLVIAGRPQDRDAFAAVTIDAIRLVTENGQGL